MCSYEDRFIVPKLKQYLVEMGMDEIREWSELVDDDGNCLGSPFLYQKNAISVVENETKTVAIGTPRCARCDSSCFLKE